MAGSVGDCERMIAAADRAGITLMIAQKKRFHPFYAYLKAQTQGEWGPIKWAQVRFALGRVEKDWFWKEGDGGGPLVENAVHVFDLLNLQWRTLRARRSASIAISKSPSMGKYSRRSAKGS